MIRRGLLTLLVLASSFVILLGLMSYAYPLPADSIIIEGTVKSPRVQVGMIRGVCHLVVTTSRPPPPGGTGFVSSYSPTFRRTGPEYLYIKDLDYGSVHAAGAGAPFWLVSGLLLLWPTLAWWHGPLRRRRRRRRGECVCCGYNLTGLDGIRCPECGRLLASAASKPVRF